VHPRFRTLTTSFLFEDLVSGPQRQVFFLGTSFQVCLEVWTGYWEFRFRSFIEDSGHFGSGPRRFWGPRSFQDLVLFLSPQTDKETDTMFAFIYRIYLVWRLTINCGLWKLIKVFNFLSASNFLTILTSMLCVCML
jgi:hypothetical protein